MTGMPIEYGLVLAGMLFVIGLVGVLVRRNLIIVLASIEIMLNAAGLAFVVGRRALGHGRRPGDVHLHPRHGGRGGRPWAWPWRCSSGAASAGSTSTPPTG